MIKYLQTFFWSSADLLYFSLTQPSPDRSAFGIAWIQLEHLPETGCGLLPPPQGCIGGAQAIVCTREIRLVPNGRSLSKRYPSPSRCTADGHARNAAPPPTISNVVSIPIRRSEHQGSGTRSTSEMTLVLTGLINTITMRIQNGRVDWKEWYRRESNPHALTLSQVVATT